MNLMKFIFLLISLPVLLTGCSPTRLAKQEDLSKISQLRLIDVYELPPGSLFRDTIIGGLSGIDYDSKNNLYYLICDDRSDVKPSRFYTAKIQISDKGIDSVQFLDERTLLDKDKRPYANLNEDPFRRTDPEGIRYNPKNQKLYWTSEGEKNNYKGQLILIDPSINVIDKSGTFIDSFLLPSNIHVRATDIGVRRNGAFEGLSFEPNFDFLYVCVEEPLYEDGPRAGLGDSTAWIRFIKYDVSSRRPIAQFAYKIDAIPYPANPPTAFKINGVPEILYLGENKMLVIERSFSTGRLDCSIRIYLADLSGASDVSEIQSLQTSTTFKAINKRLLLNMDNLGRYIDNVEGLTFGPMLPNGNPTLLFVTDDNFSPPQKTQFFLFEVIR